MSTYAVFYRVKDKSGNYREKDGIPLKACYSDIYRSVFAFKTLEIWVLKKYNGIGDCNKMTYTSEEVYEYASYLKKAGFRFEITDDVLKTTYYGEHDAYKFHIICEENSSLMLLILMNAIRYLHETTFVEISKYFLKLCRDRGRFNPFNLLLMAHSVNSGICNGHSIGVHYLNPFHFHTPQERREILTSKAQVSGTTQMMKMKSISNADFNLIAKSIKEDDTATAVKNYKELETKYGKR